MFWAFAGFTQTIRPGSAPSAPPPQPGQLGPARPAQTDTGNTETPPTAAPTENDNAPGSLFNLGGVTTRRVLVPTTVIDKDTGDYVNSLSAENFKVYDNDHLQKVISELSYEPLSLVLVVQANSEVEPFLPKIRNAGLLLHGLVTGEGGDVAILAFDHRMQWIQDFTTNVDKIDYGMQKIYPGSSSAALIDAVMAADHALVQHDPGNHRRRVILLLSRNLDKGSEMHSHLKEAARRMQFDNVTVYAVNISKFLTALEKKPDYPGPQNGGIPPEAMPNTRGNGTITDTNVVQQEDGNLLNMGPVVWHSVEQLFKVATPAQAFTAFTGGRIYSFSGEKSLETAITDIGDELQSQYLISYSPTDKNEPGFHKITIDVDRPGLDIRARPG
ncbi:MAG TPA: VWA domain-containing protein, partial [Bryobacteraceae bacterium]|nr:VWA domain-containing protein [Bryobacteraceae bacterium]